MKFLFNYHSSSLSFRLPEASWLSVRAGLAQTPPPFAPSPHPLAPPQPLKELQGCGLVVVSTADPGVQSREGECWRQRPGERPDLLAHWECSRKQGQRLSICIRTGAVGPAGPGNEGEGVCRLKEIGIHWKL
ncbi:unnamed protein product [Lota lota]